MFLGFGIWDLGISFSFSFSLFLVLVGFIGFNLFAMAPYEKELSEYEKIRKRNVEENRKMLESLGLLRTVSIKPHCVHSKAFWTSICC